MERPHVKHVIDCPKAHYPGHLVLASSSKRRQRLMEQAGYDFEVRTPRLGEDKLHPRDPRVLAESLAYAKARQVADESIGDFVIGADTIVVVDEEVIGKPADEADAREILSRLSGTTHEVITGLCVLNPQRGDRLIGADVTRIKMRKITPAELDEYLAGGEGLGKAGAYAIQQNGDRFIEEIEGSFSNVVGLPMCLLAGYLDVMKDLFDRK